MFILYAVRYSVRAVMDLLGCCYTSPCTELVDIHDDRDLYSPQLCGAYPTASIDSQYDSSLIQVSVAHWCIETRINKPPSPYRSICHAPRSSTQPRYMISSTVTASHAAPNYRCFFVLHRALYMYCTLYLVGSQQSS